MIPTCFALSINFLLLGRQLGLCMNDIPTPFLPCLDVYIWLVLMHFSVLLEGKWKGMVSVVYTALRMAFFYGLAGNSNGSCNGWVVGSLPYEY